MVSLTDVCPSLQDGHASALNPNGYEWKKDGAKYFQDFIKFLNNFPRTKALKKEL